MLKKPPHVPLQKSTLYAASGVSGSQPATTAAKPKKHSAASALHAIRIARCPRKRSMYKPSTTPPTLPAVVDAKEMTPAFHWIVSGLSPTRKGARFGCSVDVQPERNPWLSPYAAKSSTHSFDAPSKRSVSHSRAAEKEDSAARESDADADGARVGCAG